MKALTWTIRDVMRHLQDLTVQGGAVSLIQPYEGEGQIYLRVDAEELQGKTDLLLRILNRRLPAGKNLRKITERATDDLALSAPVYDLVLRLRESLVPVVTTWASVGPQTPEPPKLFKNDESSATFSARIITIKDDPGEDQHYIRAVILEPGVVDLTQKNPDGTPTGAAGDIIATKEDVRDAMHYWMEHSGVITLSHVVHGGRPMGPEDICLLESFQMPADGELDGQPVREGAWVQAHRVRNQAIWKAFKSGELKSWSIGAGMHWEFVEVDPEEVAWANRVV